MATRGSLGGLAASTREVADVLFRGKPPRQAVTDLMERDLKAEQWR